MGGRSNCDPERGRGRWAARLAAAAVSAAALWLAAPADADPVAGASGYVDLPVTFHIQNTNTSGLQCPSDNLFYDVKGHIVGPRSALAGPQVREASLYLYGFETGEWNWRLRPVPGYDFAAEMVKGGHVSVTIDMLGYDSSGHPNGSLICLGSQADVTHQIIQKLRHGDYVATGGPPVSFSKVVLIAHDVGGGAAEIEAYSYKDIDALILMSWADQVFTTEPFELGAKASLICDQGGEDAETGAPGGGYVHFAPTEESYWREKLFVNYEEDVFQATLALRNRNPCGYLPSIPPTFALSHARDGEIRVPVLLVYTDHDPIFTREAEDLQDDNYTGTNDVTTFLIANTGHFPMLERAAPTLRAIVSNWLCERDLVAIPCKLGSTDGATEGGGGSLVGGLP